MTITYKKALLVSNVCDPLTKDESDLISVYEHISKSGRYDGIETRVVEGDALVPVFNRLNQWQTVYWLTGQLDREGLCAASTDETLRVATITRIKQMIYQSIKTHVHTIGIASGKTKGDRSAEMDAFEKSVHEILDYIAMQDKEINIIIEPLDAFAHKKNVIGTTSQTHDFLKRFDQSLFTTGKLSICWDSAHVMLNEDQVATSLQTLAPYISRVHFSNAVLDKDDERYGDWHMDIDPAGFLNQDYANSILKTLNATSNHQDTVYVSVEIRETRRENVWNLEDQCYTLITEAINAVEHA